ncbi:MAG TPA: hypothetical protein DEV81_06005 [Cyanobacteria bacterium UBA11049]|nr:hypothetical protein [Cyanobacteria bacterium UBA11049]
MVTVVVVINLAVALILLYLAWQLWQLRQRLANVTDTLIAVERSTHEVLRGAAEAISLGQQGIHGLRRGNKPLQLQLQQVRQVLSLFALGQQAWRRFSRRTPLLKQPLAKYR